MFHFKKRQLTEIFAKYYLGLSQGKEIIEWANDILINESDFDRDFINKLAFLDKSDKWAIAKAEDIFFNYYKINNDEILETIKIFFLGFLEKILRRNLNLYELVDIVIRINDKYKQPKWTNDLNGFCAYLMPDDLTLTENSRFESEIKKTISDLKQDLNNTK